MSLITLKQGLDMAEAGNYALGMFNIISLEYAEAVVRAAERVRLPVILGFPEAFFRHHDVEIMGPLLLVCRARGGALRGAHRPRHSVRALDEGDPVRLHLDHV